MQGGIYMLKEMFKKNASNEKTMKKDLEMEQLHFMFMSVNQVETLPILFPIKSENECIAGSSCDLFR